MIDDAREKYHLSIRLACKILHRSRTVNRYKPETKKDDAVIEVLLEPVDKYPRYGFDKLFQIIRRHGHKWNHKRGHRVYCW